jgi:uncharacterized protein (DUF1015 family)
MVDIRAFRALRYTDLAGDLSCLITQPYDKIDSEMQRKYYEMSPYNYCRLILPLEESRYAVAAGRIRDWLREGVLAKEEKPAFFVCRQDFSLDGQTCVRTGLIAALRLYNYSENVVFPHEVTYSAPKTDRLHMLRTVQKDLEPVFLMYSDPEKTTLGLFSEVTKVKPIIVVQDSFGVRHTVWRVTDTGKIRQLREVFEGKTAVITDGHHRYESALAYSDEKHSEPGWNADAAFNFHMSILVPIEDEGLVVLPTHRLLRKYELTDEGLNALKQVFTVTEISPTVEGLDSFLEAHKNEHAFAVYAKSSAYGLVLKHKESVYEFVRAESSKETKVFDVVILRDVIFKAVLKTGELKMDEDIFYERWTKTAVARVDSGEAKLAFLLNPISAETIWQVAHQHERMPEKTTDFYPKPASGLMMMDVSNGETLE